MTEAGLSYTPNSPIQPETRQLGPLSAAALTLAIGATLIGAALAGHVVGAVMRALGYRLP